MMKEFLLEAWRPAVEIGIIWFVFYIILTSIRGTRAIQVLKGLMVQYNI